jgi:hypothetical protein
MRNDLTVMQRENRYMALNILENMRSSDNEHDYVLRDTADGSLAIHSRVKGTTKRYSFWANPFADDIIHFWYNDNPNVRKNSYQRQSSRSSNHNNPLSPSA